MENNSQNKLNPQFDDLNNAQVLKKHIEELTLSAGSVFPVDAFPKQIQEIIKALNSCLCFPTDFISASILGAISTAIGNTYITQLKRGDKQNAVVYIAIVGRPGTNKSQPLSFAFKPIENFDNIEFQRYKKEEKAYKIAMALPQKERIKQGIDEPIEPVLRQMLVSDFTPESLAKVHEHNERGLCVLVDELASWFKNFDRYNKGSEEQSWLSIWSCKPVRISRKTSGSILINNPFISVIGTTQPGVLIEVLKGRMNNGFFDRLLFVIPDNINKPYWSEKELESNIENMWENIINTLLKMPIHHDENLILTPTIIQFSDEAKQLLFAWQRNNTDISNDTDIDAIKGIRAKIELYAIRFSLILEMAQYACGESDKTEITLKSVEGAIRLVNYFITSALKAHSIISCIYPVDKLTKSQRDLYNELPTCFTTTEGKKITESIGLSARTFFELAKNEELFKKIKHGEYQKL